MEQLDLAIRTLFQEFHEAVWVRRRLEQQLRETKTFVRKRIKEKTYWYQQHYQQGRMCQQYYGVSTPERDLSIEQKRTEYRQLRVQLRQLRASELRRSAMLRRGGLPSLDATHALIIERMSNAGLICDDGILIGSMAFLAYGGYLGVTFDSASLFTQDIDSVQEAMMTVSQTGAVDVLQLLSKGKQGFRAVPGLSHKDLPTSLVGPAGIRVDFLTPLRGRPRGVQRASRMQGMGLLPMHFLDYLIKEPIRGVILAPRGGIPVVLPDPARFAVHKLIVAMRRPVTENAKRSKDLAQASQLLDICANERPGELAQVYREAEQRGKQWRKLLQQARTHLAVALQNKLQSLS